jgi:hypothetical protein
MFGGFGLLFGVVRCHVPSVSQEKYVSEYSVERISEQLSDGGESSTVDAPTISDHNVFFDANKPDLSPTETERPDENRDSMSSSEQDIVLDKDQTPDDISVADQIVTDPHPADEQIAADKQPAAEGTPDLADMESSNQSCTFNQDCPEYERCECDENTGCLCKIGVRGTGVNGVDTCTNGNDCQSSLCAEGNSDIYYCSGPCQNDADCGINLPICSNIAYIGKICIRKK